MAHFLLVAWLITCSQLSHYASSGQELKPAERQAEAAIQVLSVAEEAAPTLDLKSRVRPQNLHGSKVVVQSKGKETGSSSSPNREDQDSDNTGRSIQLSASNLKTQKWLEKWARNLDRYSELMYDFTSGHGSQTIHTNGFIRPNRGRVGRMPLAFGKRARASPLLDFANPARILTETSKSKPPPDSKTIKWPDNELETYISGQFFTEAQLHPSSVSKDEESRGNGIESKVLAEYLSSNSKRGRLQRMPYAFGKRLFKQSGMRHLKNIATRHNIKNLVNIPNMFTPRSRKKSLHSHLAQRLIKEIDNQSTELLARTLDGESLEQTKRCKHGHEHAVECLISKKTKQHPLIEDRVPFAENPVFSRDQRSRLGRMPLTFGKRVKTCADFFSPERKKKGSLRRMPIAFGKRSNSGETIAAPRTSLHLALWGLPLPGDNFGPSDKRGSLRRMPLSFGKRGRTDSPGELRKETDSKSPYLQGALKEGSK